MAKSWLGLRERWRLYQTIPVADRDIYDLIWALTGRSF